MQNMFLTLAKLGMQYYIMLALVILFITLMWVFKKTALVRIFSSLVLSYAVVAAYTNLMGTPFEINIHYIIMAVGAILTLAGLVVSGLQKTPGLVVKIIATLALLTGIFEMIFV
ncbi:MAG: hypothetical protein K6F52_07975 [Clostridia bacterium]|nr:hypothetical protein [Clostridia bacterium]